MVAAAADTVVAVEDVEGIDRVRHFAGQAQWEGVQPFRLAPGSTLVQPEKVWYVSELARRMAIGFLGRLRLQVMTGGDPRRESPERS